MSFAPALDASSTFVLARPRFAVLSAPNNHQNKSAIHRTHIPKGIIKGREKPTRSQLHQCKLQRLLKQKTRHQYCGGEFCALRAQCRLVSHSLAGVAYLAAAAQRQHLDIDTSRVPTGTELSPHNIVLL